MYKILLFIFFQQALFSHEVFAQVGQLTINRVAQMPNLPAPYLMRNWKDVAIKYDEFIFSTSSSGQYLPLIGLKPTGTNYPLLSPILLQTYVGSNSTNQAEAINIMPAMVGASLVGIDKSNQAGINWAEKTKDFFNNANGQHVYLNGYATTSGGDWWYDVMPNIFFYQAYTQYPGISGFDQQFTSVADRWLAAVHAMGGDTTPWTVPEMNYRAWNLITMTGDVNGVKEPEAAGGIGWLLYHAYLTTGNKKYLEGAQMAVEFLAAYTTNPSYELQLPYGAFIAAKMNAELGTMYDIPKIINWCFDRGALRGWGAIKGTWNGADVDGLIGEVNDNGDDYAFAMNGFQQAAALVPMIKYDKRYARDVAKWTLNMANASRLFYSPYLPAVSQDDFTWSSTHDPQSVIAYEALKEVWEGKPLYGTGDAKRNNWAQTNLGLYGSSHVGYLGAILEATDVAGILVLDLNKTDFFNEGGYPAYALYNPYAVDKLVTLTLPSGVHDIYDAISETIISTGVSGSTSITVKADEVVLLVYIPSGLTPSSSNGKLYAGTQVIDYHYGYDFTGSLRIKSLAVADTLVEFNQQVPVYVKVDNAATTVTYSWIVNGVTVDTNTADQYTWTVPATAGSVVLKLQIESGGKSALDSIVFHVVQHIPIAPTIKAISTDRLSYTTGSQVVLSCDAIDETEASNELVYTWIVNNGTIVSANGATLIWQAPSTEAVYEITCEVTDKDQLTTTATKLILVKQLPSATAPAFAYYPLDGDVNDYSGNSRHAKMAGVDAVADARGLAGKAYLFNSGGDIIFVDNSSVLNFQNAITLSFWVKLNSLSDESFILSHGSWEDRWKVSVIPNGHLRWTVKTDTGTRDLDTSFPLALNQFYHFAVVYSGYSMEIYADGELNNFFGHSGLMGTTTKALTFGRKDEGTTNYGLRGVLDEVRIYNATLAPDEISTLKTTWSITTGIEEVEENIRVYSNPTTQDFYIMGIQASRIKKVTIFDLNGCSVNFTCDSSGEQIRVMLNSPNCGLLILRIQTVSEVYHKKIIGR